MHSFKVQVYEVRKISEASLGIGLTALAYNTIFLMVRSLGVVFFLPRFSN